MNKLVCPECKKFFFKRANYVAHRASHVEPGVREWFEGKLLPVVNSSRCGWWRFHEHYDRDGYCDNPARGY